MVLFLSDLLRYKGCALAFGRTKPIVKMGQCFFGFCVYNRRVCFRWNHYLQHDSEDKPTLRLLRWFPCVLLYPLHYYHRAPAFRNTCAFPRLRFMPCLEGLGVRPCVRFMALTFPACSFCGWFNVFSFRDWLNNDPRL